MKLLLLLYVPRSGSTFFADFVSREFSEILVLPELRLPRLLTSKEFLSLEPGKSVLMNLVKQDHQFPELGLSDTDVEACIDAMGDYSAEDFLQQIASRLASKSGLSPEAVLYKCGSAGRRWQALREQLPTTRFIHIYRDARAAVNSAMHTMRPYHPRQRMGRGDPWFRAQAWDRFVGNMQRLKARGEPIIEVRYEAFCQSPDLELDRLSRELGISRSRATDTQFAISAREAAIHSNVGENPMHRRIDAWHDEMPRWQGLVVEHVAAEQLASRGYAEHYSARTGLAMKWLAIAYGMVYHAVATGYFYGRRVFRRPTANGRG